MLPKGLLSRPLDYFFTHQDVYDGEAERSVFEFFNITNAKDLKKVLLSSQNAMQAGIVDEWLLFDFKMKNGNTLIEEYIQRSFTTDDEQKMYGDLLHTNFYSFFETKEVMLDEGLVLCDLKTNQNYQVREKSATHDLQKGNLLFARLAQVRGHWEMVGANSFVIPTVKIDKDLRKLYLEDKNPITPKMAFDMAENKSEKSMESWLPIDPVKAKEHFKKELEAAGLDAFVSIDLVEKWCREIDDKSGTKVISLLINLGENDEQKINNTFMRAFSDFANTIGKNSLNGKSPQEVIKEQKNWRPKLQMSFTKHGAWWKELEKAHEYMAKRNPFKAVGYFEKTFAALQKQSAVDPNVYRFYANAAVCYFNDGDQFLGKVLLAMSLNLNPNYDFGQKLMRDYQNGMYDESIAVGIMGYAGDLFSKKRKVLGFKKNHRITKEIIDEILKKVTEISSKEPEDEYGMLEKLAEKHRVKDFGRLPSVIYYQYIKELGINLKTDTLTTSKVIVYNPAGKVVQIGRNEPCYCKSGKKYKHCHNKPI